MRHDGWFWTPADATNKSIRRRILREMIVHRLFPHFQTSP